MTSCDLQQLPPWLPQLRSLHQVHAMHCDMSQRETQWSSCAPALRIFSCYRGPVLRVNLGFRV